MGADSPPERRPARDRLAARAGGGAPSPPGRAGGSASGSFLLTMPERKRLPRAPRTASWRSSATGQVADQLGQGRVLDEGQAAVAVVVGEAPERLGPDGRLGMELVGAPQVQGSFPSQ